MFTISRNQRSYALFINSSNSLSSVVYSNFYKISEFFSLRQENNRLFNENLNLKKALFAQKKYKDTIYSIDDSIRKTQYTYYSATVVKNSVTSENNFITLDKGSKDGIEKDMGVVNEEGIVGIVVNVSRHYCIVLSVLNKLNSIGCKLKNSDYFGVIDWDGVSYKNVILDGIPNHIKIKIGDTVVTSGYSTYFPEGITVGKIESFNKNLEDNFYTIKLRLATDFKKLSKVYLIKNKLSNEQIELELETEDNFK